MLVERANLHQIAERTFFLVLKTFFLFFDLQPEFSQQILVKTFVFGFHPEFLDHQPDFGLYTFWTFL